MNMNNRTKCCGSISVDDAGVAWCAACGKDGIGTFATDTPLRWEITVKTVGNPDFQQYSAITSPTPISANTLNELRDRVANHKDYWQIGGGNWTNPAVHKDGKRVGFMSYNGRIWKGKTGKNATVEVEL